jgi:hypothetical protein
VPSQLRALRVNEVRAGGLTVPAMRVAPERRLGEDDARRLVTFVLEALDGRRPLPQLAGVVGEDVVRGLRVAPEWRRLGRLRLGRLRVCRVAPDAAEIFGTVLRGERVHAVAARVEHVDGSWVCTVFKVLV